MTPKKRKRQRVDSASEQTRIMASAFLDLKPPKHVRMKPRDLPFFDEVIAEFAKADWSKHMLTIAALLARALGGMEDEQWKLHEEGCVAKSDRGTPVVNPRKAVVQMYAGTILALRRSLSLHARAQGVNKNRIAEKNDNAKAIENMAIGLDDELIARPPLN